MNLKLGNGKIPIWRGDTIVMADMPPYSLFSKLYTIRVSDLNRERYYGVIMARIGGATLAEAGAPYGISRERARQIEAKFLRLFSRYYLAKTS